MAELTPKSLRAQADKLEKKLTRQKKEPLITFSKFVMGGIMLMYFVGVYLGSYATIYLGEPVSVTLDYIMQLAKIVSLGYFVKAFGESIARIILSAVCGRFTDSNNEGA